MYNITALLFLSLTLAAQQSFSVPVKNSQTSKNVWPLTQGGEDPDPIIRDRRNFVKKMMKDAWDDYVRYAWGDNELSPVSQTGHTGVIFGDAKIGASIVDSLDTLYIMEMMDELADARNYVANQLDFSEVNATISVFETNIRFIGGFLTAYVLTGDEIYKTRAEELATLLLPAFDTPTGIPYGYINIKTGEPVTNRDSVLAEFGTLHLEWMYLSNITGNPIFAEKVETIRNLMNTIEKPNGLYWNFFDPVTGNFTQNHVSIGALGDSFYEYLLKASIQLGDEQARTMYDEAMDAMIANGMMKVSNQSHLLYIAEIRNNEIDDVVGHLACFAGGMFALGAHKGGNYSNQERDMEIGTNFTNTCRESYIRSTSRIGPELFRFTETLEAEAELDGEKYYIQRPEVIESYFVLYRITGDPKYREWGWSAAQNIDRWGKAGPGRGYSGLRNVYDSRPEQDDVQQSFFLAETLKYLYLLFSTNDLIDIDNWVFNTEAHPLPVRGVNPLY